MKPLHTLLLPVALLAMGPTTLAQAPAPKPEPGHNCFCTMEYNPVCARTRDGELKTFPNECHARCAEAEILSRGLCPTGDRK